MTLVQLDASSCPECDGTLVEHIADEPALLRHGGYGATRRTRRRSCVQCGWSLTVERGEVHPCESA